MAHASGSTCHGAGRRMSRTQAVRVVAGADLARPVARLKPFLVVKG